MTTPFYINGRILLRDHGGVRRYASEVANNLSRAQVVKPRAAKRRWSGRAWEQTTLLRRSSNGVLLNMAHSGPALHPRQVNVIHDLFAITDPGSVHPAFAALMRIQIPRLIANASQLVTVSSHVADEIASSYSVARSDIAVVPPGISSIFCRFDPAAARVALNLDPERPVVAALLDPTPRKNSVGLVEVLREIQAQQPDVQVVVAGKRQAPSFGRARRPTLPASRTGFLDLAVASDAQLATMYQGADVFISLTRAEGFGLPAVEAASCGAAVVTTTVPSIAEHCASGAVVVGDGEAAGQATLELLNDPARRRDLVARAQTALGDLQWSKTAASLEACMTQVATQ